MVNKASNSGHIPERTCVICRKKEFKEKLIRFIIKEDTYIIDSKQKVSSRGYYVCDENCCLTKLEKWVNKQRKKNRLAVMKIK